MPKKKKNNLIESNLKLKGIVEDIVIQEAFEQLQVNIGLASVDKQVKVIQVTSSSKDEGKTTTAINLAFSYMNRGFKVLVIDLDFRRPKVHRNFDIVNENGIVDFVSGKCQKDKLIKNTKYNIDLILAGSKTPYPAKILESDLLKELINELRNAYDYIIVDTSPVSMVVDPILIAKYSDGVLFVVQAEKTKKSLIKESISILENAQANILGLAITSVKDKSSRYKYNHYYED